MWYDFQEKYWHYNCYLNMLNIVLVDFLQVVRIHVWLVHLKLFIYVIISSLWFELFLAGSLHKFYYLIIPHIYYITTYIARFQEDMFLLLIWQFCCNFTFNTVLNINIMLLWGYELLIRKWQMNGRIWLVGLDFKDTVTTRKLFCNRTSHRCKLLVDKNYFSFYLKVDFDEQHQRNMTMIWWIWYLFSTIVAWYALGLNLYEMQIFVHLIRFINLFDLIRWKKNILTCIII